MNQILCLMTADQARAVTEAMDAYSRLCIGQLNEVASLVRQGVIPMANHDKAGERTLASIEICDQIEALMNQAKLLLGYPVGGSHSIGHPDVSLSGRRNYEVYKVITRVLAEDANPAPAFRGVSYDGLGPRYTNDPEPVATIIQSGDTHG